jgi:hypothetical protein
LHLSQKGSGFNFNDINKERDTMEYIKIIGDPLAGNVALALAVSRYHAPLLHVVDSQFTEPSQPKVFEITRIPEFIEPWIDPNESVFNQHKHNQTCAKNRKKRNKKIRR